jgi:phosphate ABC transporter permease protein PstC
MSLSNKIGKSYVAGSAFLSAGIILLILLFLLANSWDAIRHNGTQLFALEWNPARARFGILPMLYGSTAVLFISLSIALPLGLTTAIFVSEILPQRFRLYAKSLLELLAGIPSIIYGLIGIVFFSMWIENLFDLQSGRTILTGGLLLAVMVLPTLITLSDDALQHVPQKYREAARSLGLYKFEVIQKAVLPLAKSNLIGAALLGMGRVLGETMAVMLVIGSIDKLPSPLTNLLVPGQTMTSKLGREIAETAFGSLHFSAIIFIGFLLLLFVVSVTMVALTFFDNPENRIYE